MLGGIGETIGYIDRVGSAYDVTLNYHASDMPHHLTSALLRWSVRHDWKSVTSQSPFTNSDSARIAGPRNTLLKPLWYFVIFSSLDLAALVIQAIGGSRASLAEQNGNNTTPATHIMVTFFHSFMLINSLLV